MDNRAFHGILQLARRQRDPLRNGSQLDTGLLRSLGELVVAFSVLEESLKLGIIGALPFEDRVATEVLITGMSFSVLVEKFGALHFELTPHFRNQVKEFSAYLLQLNDERNTLIHSLWLLEPDNAVARTFRTSAKAKTGLRTKSQDITQEHVRDLVTKLRGADDKFWELYMDLQPNDESAG